MIQTGNLPECAHPATEPELFQLDGSGCVLFVGWLSYPFGSAGASRIRHMAKGLRFKGISSHVISTKRLERRICDRQPDRRFEFEGTTYETTNGFSDGQRKPVWRRGLDLMAAIRKSWQRTRELVQAGDVRAVILYSRSHMQCQPTIDICKRHGVPVVVDAVEWYLYWKTPYFLSTFDHFMGMHFSHRKVDGAIAISSFLKRRFAGWGVPVIRIPAMHAALAKGKADFSSGCRIRNNGLDAVYVGQFKPDESVDDLLEGVRMAISRGCPVNLNIIGNDGHSGNGKKVRERVEQIPELAPHVHFLGRLPEKEYRERLHIADVLILLRKPIQRSLAAFPTRIPEFLATGNPLITNDVMDIPLYLSDGNHAHVVPAGRPECIAERLIAINEDPAGSRRIGESGRVRLGECFDYRPLTEKVAHFLKGLP